MLAGTRLARYAAYGVASGLPADRMAKTVDAIRDRLPVLSPQDDEALMREAGFGDVSLCYAALDLPRLGGLRLTTARPDVISPRPQ